MPNIIPSATPDDTNPTALTPGYGSASAALKAMERYVDSTGPIEGAALKELYEIASRLYGALNHSQSELANAIEHRDHWHAELMCADMRIAELGRQRHATTPAEMQRANGTPIGGDR
ncbi:hypothetical protein [Streptomyces niveus]|uniref:hypothetical protein n=1 Tax=Streptomyces niveus TaxID=193462 RepID=UPI00386FA181